MMQEGDADIIKATPRIIEPITPPKQKQKQKQDEQQQQKQQKRSVQQDWEIPPMSQGVKPCFRHVRQSFMGPVEERYKQLAIEKQQVDCSDPTITDFKMNELGCYVEM